MTIPTGPAAILSIYIDDGEKHRDKPLYEVIMNTLTEKGIAGATLFRGVSGYGSDGVRHTSKILRLMENMPLKIEVVDEEKKLKALLPELKKLVQKGLITITPTTVVLSKFEPHG